MRGRNRDALGAVNGRATAHGDQAVATLGLEHLDSGAHCRFCGVGWRLVKHGHLHAGHGIQHLLQHASGLDALIGYHQRAGDADALALLGQQRGGAVVDLDLGDVVDESHGVMSRSLDLGCAVANRKIDGKFTADYNRRPA